MNLKAALDTVSDLLQSLLDVYYQDIKEVAKWRTMTRFLIGHSGSTTTSSLMILLSDDKDLKKVICLVHNIFIDGLPAHYKFRV